MLTLEQAKFRLEIARSGLYAAARRYARVANEFGEAPDEGAELESRAEDFILCQVAVGRLRDEAWADER